MDPKGRNERGWRRLSISFPRANTPQICMALHWYGRSKAWTRRLFFGEWAVHSWPKREWKSYTIQPNQVRLGFGRRSRIILVSKNNLGFLLVFCGKISRILWSGLILADSM